MSTNPSVPGCSALLGVLLVACVGVAGCGGKSSVPPPKTYPVTGRVVVPGGGPPAGARIQFEPEDARLMAGGKIEADGSFSLTLLFDGRKLPGATEGPHRATLITPLNADRSGGERIVLEQTYTVEPKDNDFTITMTE